LRLIANSGSTLMISLMIFSRSSIRPLDSGRLHPTLCGALAS
jgi:hypothetical protein